MAVMSESLQAENRRLKRLLAMMTQKVSDLQKSLENEHELTAWQASQIEQLTAENAELKNMLEKQVIEPLPEVTHKPTDSFVTDTLINLMSLASAKKYARY